MGAVRLYCFAFLLVLLKVNGLNSVVLFDAGGTVKFANSANITHNAVKSTISIYANTLSVQGSLTLGGWNIGAEMALLSSQISALQSSIASLNSLYAEQNQKLASIVAARTPSASMSPMKCSDSSLPMDGSTQCSIRVLTAAGTQTSVAPSSLTVSVSPSGVTLVLDLFVS